MKKNKRKIFRILWFSFVAIFLLWQGLAFQSRDLPANTFQTVPGIEVVETSDEIIFKPLKNSRDLEVIFFQGGLADPKAYAPLCRRLAEEGFTCHLIKMSFRLPQYDYNKIKKLFNLEEGNFALGGHSQGAKMAAQFAYENPGLIKGLFLMGTSHPRDIDLSHLEIPTLKLYAEKDGLASVGEVMDNKKKLPKNTWLVFVKGANHSQFGYLGKVLGDNSPTIPLEQQQEVTVKNIIHLLKGLENEY